MNREQVFAYAEAQFGTLPDYPWMDDNAVLRHGENNKWYAVLLAVGRDRLGLPGGGTSEVINLKCGPILAGSLRTREGFHPAYHMNKEQWISIRLDGTVPAEEIRQFIDLSYKLTGPKKRKG